MRDNTFFGQRFTFPDIDSIWNFNDLEETARKIRSQIDEINDGLNLRSLELETQWAHVQALLGKTQEAQTILDSVKQQIVKLGAGANKRLEIRYLLESGRLACLLRTPDQAQVRFMGAWELAIENGEDFFAIDAALMLAFIQPAKSQAEWLERALSIALKAEDSAPPKLWLPQIYKRRGWTFFDLRQFEAALSDFESALSGLPPGNTDLRLSTEWSIARTYRALNRVDEALAIQQSLLQKVTPETCQGLARGYVLWEIAECFLSQKKTSEAQDYFDQALNEFSAKESFKNSNPAGFSRIQHLADKKYR